jgi:hypothetical protein
LRAEKGQKWKKPVKILKNGFLLTDLFIALPKFFATHPIYEILSKSLVPTGQAVVPARPSINMHLWSEHYLLLSYAVESIMILFGVPVRYSGVNTLTDSSTMVKRGPIQRKKVFIS